MIFSRNQSTRALLLSMTLTLSAAAAAASDGPDRLLTNEGLVMLARAGYNERFLTELIGSKPGQFDTSVEGLVYLAKQGVSEKMVRTILALQKAAEARKAEASTAEEEEQPPAPAIGPAAARPGPTVPRSRQPQPVRMRVVTQKVLMPENQSAQLGPNPVIMVKKRMLGADRYYALPAAQAPVATTMVAPRSNAVAALPVVAATPATHVAAFH